MARGALSILLPSHLIRRSESDASTFSAYKPARPIFVGKLCEALEPSSIVLVGLLFRSIFKPVLLMLSVFTPELFLVSL